ncbi:hypothetical protein Lal_00031552 [Lupinus albus]|nr:hypothetical protein Lal_00031552 [Lupinus albus]
MVEDVDSGKFILGGVSWKSKLRRCVALSTAEAKYFTTFKLGNERSRTSDTSQIPSYGLVLLPSEVQLGLHMLLKEGKVVPLKSVLGYLNKLVALCECPGSVFLSFPCVYRFSALVVL